MILFDGKGTMWLLVMEEDYIDEGHVAVDRDDNHVLEQLGYYSKQVLRRELIGLIMR